MATAPKASNALLEAALSYAAKGLPVFPCHHETKEPLVRHGFKDASVDNEVIGRWWLRWPDAMIGMPTGAMTGFWALDVDDPPAFEAACKIDLPATRRTDTGKGYHLLWKFDPERPVRNAQRHPRRGWPLAALPGAEVRGEGGYVIVPPSVHPSGREYRWHDSATVVDPPEALLRIVRRPRVDNDNKHDNRTARGANPNRAERDTAYGLAALDAECRAIREAGDGEQEAALHEAAIKIGSLVAGGELNKATARNQLIAAGLALHSFDPRNPWSPELITTKVDGGMAFGAQSPRSAPPRASDGVLLDDFRAYMPTHSYFFVPTGELWPASSVNARIAPVPLVDRQGKPLLDENGKPKTIKAATWLDEHRPVEQVTWAPGEPQVIENRLMSDGGWFNKPGCNVFNQYRPPCLRSGDAGQASPWVDHIKRVYPDDAEHLIRWLAHRTQRPEEKINHALVMGGSQGIGKDTILEPVKAAIGPWNFAEVSPQHLLGRFNSFVKSVILRISEARDLGDIDRFAFYDHMKTYTAAPPDVLRVDEKHLREYSALNVCGVIITSNHKSDGIYLPADDRRHYVAWSDAAREDFSANYWNDLYGWYRQGGTEHVGAYLRCLDLGDFDAKAPPPKTDAFWDIVGANRTPEEAELSDALEKLGWPDAVTISRVASYAVDEFREFLLDRRNARRVPHRFEECGYVQARNPSAQDGLFKVDGKRCVIYAKKALSRREQLAAAERLAYPGQG